MRRRVSQGGETARAGELSALRRDGDCAEVVHWSHQLSLERDGWDMKHHWSTVCMHYHLHLRSNLTSLSSSKQRLSNRRMPLLGALQCQFHHLSSAAMLLGQTHLAHLVQVSLADHMQICHFPKRRHSSDSH